MQTIPAPLATLIRACATPDAPADPSASAYDFSPLHLASFFMEQKVKPSSLSAAVDEWRDTCGSGSGKTDRAPFPEIDATLTPAEVDRLCTELAENLHWADWYLTADKFQRYPRRMYHRKRSDPEILLPLQCLLRACETLCDAACCELAAFDFSPIHIAAYLIRATGALQEKHVAELRTAIAHWRLSCGATAGKTENFTSRVMETALTPQQVDDVCSELEKNLDVALKLVRLAATDRSEAHKGCGG